MRKPMLSTLLTTHCPERVADRVFGAELGHATINGGLVSVLPRLTKQLSGGGHGVLVTSAPAAAVYHACQHGLRAVYATNGRDVGEAKNQFDANLLVVDSHGSSNGGLESFLSRG